MYKLKDYNNEVIESHFYKPELQLAYMNSNIVYKIEEILKRRKRHGVPEVLVKWKGCQIQLLDSRIRHTGYKLRSYLCTSTQSADLKKKIRPCDCK